MNNQFRNTTFAQLDEEVQKLKTYFPLTPTADALINELLFRASKAPVIGNGVGEGDMLSDLRPLKQGGRLMIPENYRVFLGHKPNVRVDDLVNWMTADLLLAEIAARITHMKSTQSIQENFPLTWKDMVIGTITGGLAEHDIRGIIDQGHVVFSFDITPEANGDARVNVCWAVHDAAYEIFRVVPMSHRTTAVLSQLSKHAYKCPDTRDVSEASWVVAIDVSACPPNLMAFTELLKNRIAEMYEKQLTYLPHAGKAGARHLADLAVNSFMQRYNPLGVLEMPEAKTHLLNISIFTDNDCICGWAPKP